MISSHTLSVLVENKPGVLARISGLFARRGFNIESLAVGASDDPSVARMTIVVAADGKPLEQVTKQLDKLINVLRIAELSRSASVERELALIKVAIAGGNRAAVLEIVKIFRARVIDVDADAVVVEATGAPDKVDALEQLLVPFGIVEIARTGTVALARGGAGLKAPELRSVPVTTRTA